MLITHVAFGGSWSMSTFPTLRSSASSRTTSAPLKGRPTPDLPPEEALRFLYRGVEGPRCSQQQSAHGSLKGTPRKHPSNGCSGS